MNFGEPWQVIYNIHPQIKCDRPDRPLWDPLYIFGFWCGAKLCEAIEYFGGRGKCGEGVDPLFRMGIHYVWTGNWDVEPTTPKLKHQ